MCQKTAPKNASFPLQSMFNQCGHVRFALQRLDFLPLILLVFRLTLALPLMLLTVGLLALAIAVASTVVVVLVAVAVVRRVVVVRGVCVIRLFIAISIAWILIIRAMVMRRAVGFIGMPASCGFLGRVVVVVAAAPVVRLVAVARRVA